MGAARVVSGEESALCRREAIRIGEKHDSLIFVIDVLRGGTSPQRGITHGGLISADTRRSV